MGRQSTIFRLPPDARATLDRDLADPRLTQIEAGQRVNAMLAAEHPGHPPVSRSAVQRYHQSARWDAGSPGGAHEIVARPASAASRDVRAAGKAMGRLLARRLPVEVRMCYVAELAAELARTSPIGESREGRK